MGPSRNQVLQMVKGITSKPDSVIQPFAAYSLFIVLSIIWGVAFVAIKVLEPFLSPVNLTLLRWMIASAGLLCLAPFVGRPNTRFQRMDVPRFLLVTLANVVVYHLAINYSEKTIAPGIAGLLVATGPVFVVILSSLFIGERHTKYIFVSIGLALSGALILSFGEEFASGVPPLAGVLEAIATAVSYAVFAVFSKPLVQKYGSRPIAVWTGLAGTVMLLPLISGGFFIQVSRLPEIGWLSILYLSLLSTVGGYMIFYTLIRRSAVTKVALQLYLIPVVSVIGGALILGEPVTVFTVLGGASLLSAVAFSTRSTRKDEVQDS